MQFLIYVLAFVGGIAFAIVDSKVEINNRYTAIGWILLTVVIPVVIWVFTSIMVTIVYCAGFASIIALKIWGSKYVDQSRK